jgi:hypothetical protein
MGDRIQVVDPRNSQQSNSKMCKLQIVFQQDYKIQAPKKLVEFVLKRIFNSFSDYSPNCFIRRSEVRNIH